jgi:hypothetical protein
MPLVMDTTKGLVDTVRKSAMSSETSIVLGGTKKPPANAVR